MLSPASLREKRDGGRYQTRTDDLFRVKEARYQLRQSPVRNHLATKEEARRDALTAQDTPAPVGLAQTGMVG